MNVLVTGDRGYIGAVLLPLLLQKKYSVVGLDANYYGDTLPKKYEDPRYRKITKDIRLIDKSDLDGIDAIIHLAALSNDPMGDLDPALTEEINFASSVRIAEIAKASGIKRFIFSSSCSIYGIAKGGIVSEQSEVNPLTAYAKSKIEAEKELLRMVSKDFCIGILRNSTVYGYSPKFRNDLVVNSFVTTAIAFKEIRIMSDGTPWRPLVDVYDLCNIFVSFLKAESDVINGVVMNIGFEENNFQVKDIVDEIKNCIPDCNAVFTGEHGKDSRSYKVNFDLFHMLFPKIKQLWPLKRAIADMVIRLQNDGFSARDFQSGRFTRIVALKNLIANSIVDKNLYRVEK